MGVVAYWFGKAIINAFGGETADESIHIDYLSDTIKVMLCTNSYTPNQDTHEKKSDVTNEVTGDGYTAGGITLTEKTLTYVADGNKIKFDAADITWSDSTITARYAVIYDDTDAAKPLLGYVDFGQDMSSDNGNFTIQWNSNGILNATAN